MGRSDRVHELGAVLPEIRHLSPGSYLCDPGDIQHCAYEREHGRAIRSATGCRHAGSHDPLYREYLSRCSPIQSRSCSRYSTNTIRQSDRCRVPRCYSQPAFSCWHCDHVKTEAASSSLSSPRDGYGPAWYSIWSISPNSTLPHRPMGLILSCRESCFSGPAYTRTGFLSVSRANLQVTQVLPFSSCRRSFCR